MGVSLKVRPGPLSPSLVAGDLVAIVAQTPRTIDPTPATMRFNLAGAVARQLMCKPIVAIQAARTEHAARFAMAGFEMANAVRRQGSAGHAIRQRLGFDDVPFLEVVVMMPMDVQVVWLMRVVIVGHMVLVFTVMDHLSNDCQGGDSCQNLGQVIVLSARGRGESRGDDDRTCYDSGDKIAVHLYTPLFRSDEVPGRHAHRLGARVQAWEVDKQYRRQVIGYHGANARKLLYVRKTESNLTV